MCCVCVCGCVGVWVCGCVLGGKAPPCKATGWSGQGSAGKAVSARPGAAPAATSILNAVAKEQV